MILFEHPLSPYSQKVKIALREKGLPFELRVPDGLGSGAGYSEDFAGASPRVEVPALIDGDTRVFDSTIILEYLEDQYPGLALRPGSAAARARARMIEDAMDTHYEAINWGLIEIRFMGRMSDAQAAALRGRAAEQLAAWRHWLNAQLGDAPWFGGERFGWADLSVAPYVNCSASFGHPPEAGTPLAAWLARVNARPAVAQTAAEAEAAIPTLEGLDALVRDGSFKREYRDYRLEWMVKSGGLEVVLDGIAKNNIRFSADFTPHHG
ncbi:MAG: glutathione S-transferase family protein [Proteobacteria bacterium]|nr:glutathione S-transferase family protein [Pseudomonadota bacterium]